VGLRGRYAVGRRYLVTGEIRAGFGSSREVVHPELEPAENIERDRINFGRVVPIYSGIERGEQRSYRKLTNEITERLTDGLPDPIPANLVRRQGLPDLGAALREAHWPPPESSLSDLEARRTPAHRRLAFDELLLVQLGFALRRHGVKTAPGIAFRSDGEVLKRAIARLPFPLTAAQERVVSEIAADMARAEPMNRLLQGDVGSGKTAVALVATLIAVANRHQAAVMAPTELLAEQHYRTFCHFLRGAEVRIALLTGSDRGQRGAALAGLARGEVDIAVGTHALFQEAVEFRRLGVAVIDEQHRFGVLQRAALMQKGAHPDILAMTATPIPRTLAMTCFGDLDVSTISELPPGRQPVKTRLVGESRREVAWRLVETELREGHQAYVVYPLIEESAKVDLADATRGAEQLKARFPDFSVDLVHGRMDRFEREAAMERFRHGKTQVLVATTVVEVGVDVPNATVIVVESAERFGLSQLHQLRGRVRRSTHPASCFLIARYARTEGARERLAIMERTDDGFVIAEKDLEIRGPGDFLGTRQSGIPELALTDLSRHHDLLAAAREEAFRIVAEDPSLAKPEHAALRRAVVERWGGLTLARVG
jgi:ATP-dependent DNA helicase RecG